MVVESQSGWRLPSRLNGMRNSINGSSPPEAHQIIEDTKARHMGLLLPAQFKELRRRYGYSQKEMGALFQVGEKSWTRWESGKHRPSRSINLAIRALYDGELSISYLLKRAGKPARPESEWATWAQGISATWLPKDAVSQVDLLQPSASVSVFLQSKSSPVKPAFVSHLIKLVAQHAVLSGQFASPEDMASRRRQNMSPPAHTYPQPRLTTPTEA